MASQAISTQGTNVYISSGSGTAKTITAVTKAAQAVVTTSVAHTLVVGDVVNFAAVTGMPELNNVRAVIVATASATTFTVNVDSTNFVAAGTAGTATPLTYVSSCEITNFDGLDGEASEIDTTTLCSKSKEYRLGLRDAGNFSINFNVVLDDLGQAELRKAQADGFIRNVKVVLPNKDSMVFDALVKSYTVSGGVDAVLTGSSGLRITGEVSFVIAP